MNRYRAATEQQQLSQGTGSRRESEEEGEGAGRGVRDAGRGEGEALRAVANSGHVDKTPLAAFGQLALPGALSRDRELVRWIGAHGAVSIGHVMALQGIGRTAAYRRVGALIEVGLLERLELLRSEPAVLRASAAGLRYAGLGMGLARVSPALIEHWLSCASTALELGEEFGPERVASERELVLAERIEGRPIASAKLGERLHRPDLVVLAGERLIAVEVELTPKAPRRLQSLIRAWRRAAWVDEVRYYCAPRQTRRGVERAVAATHAEERVRILEAVAR